MQYGYTDVLSVQNRRFAYNLCLDNYCKFLQYATATSLYNKDYEEQSHFSFSVSSSPLIGAF